LALVLLAAASVVGGRGQDRPDAPEPALVRQAEAALRADVAELERQVERARVELVFAESRLELAQARAALDRQDHAQAARHAQAVLDRLADLPPGVDATVYELLAEGILARAERAGVRVAKRPLRPAARGEPALEPELERQAALRARYKDDEVRVLREADAARAVPQRELVFPEDWPEKLARRERFAGGLVARSRSWIDQQGREWYVGLYDIRDLTYVAPDFQPPFALDPAEELRNALDRHALRWRSGIFNSWDPMHLAAGIPLLRYFGGVDDLAWRGPKYSRERQEQIIRLIEAFTSERSEPQVIPLAP